MFVAQIFHKLTRAEKDMEDLLTSNLFGLWRYIPAEFGLVQILQSAERLDGVKLHNLEKYEIANLQFWPWMQEEKSKGAEPDVLLEGVSSDNEKCLFLIEAKYLSGKSSLADNSTYPNDQLAREMHNLRKLAGKKGITYYALIYITADSIIPRKDIQEAIDELAKKTGNGERERFYWTNWRRFPEILKEVSNLCNKPFQQMLKDLINILVIRV